MNLYQTIKNGDAFTTRAASDKAAKVIFDRATSSDVPMKDIYRESMASGRLRPCD